MISEEENNQNKEGYDIIISCSQCFTTLSFSAKKDESDSYSALKCVADKVQLDMDKLIPVPQK